ncbi:MAG: hypothetical protein IJZ62_04765 [Clostridia bacterium]|nr:hypothetical protein [Clostridia bacterium]
MTTAPAKLYYTTASKLPELQIANGQIIFTSDTHTIYLDMKGYRHSYSTIQVFEKEQNRLDVFAPVEGFYFVIETGIMWRYNGGNTPGWVQITPSNLEPIMFFDSVGDLPPTGVANTLYCTDNAIYNWKNQSYNMIANKNEWESI